MIVTSFNWLSFKGDPRRTFRDERGIYIEVAEDIETQFKDWSSRISAPVANPKANRPRGQ